jgi:hypothetical protein
VKKNLEGLGVGGQNDELGDTTVEGLGGLVGSLLQLTVVGSLLDDVEDLLGEGGIREGEGYKEIVSEMFRQAGCGKECGMRAGGAIARRSLREGEVKGSERGKNIPLGLGASADIMSIRI